MRPCWVSGDDRTRYLLHPGYANHYSAIDTRRNHSSAIACASDSYANEHPNEHTNKRPYTAAPGLGAITNVQPMQPGNVHLRCDGS